MNLLGPFLCTIAFLIVANHKKITSVYASRGKIIQRVKDSSDHERIFVGVMVFLLGLGFLLASL